MVKMFGERILSTPYHTDMFESEIDNLPGKTRKRAGGNIQPQLKQSKPTPRPSGSASNQPPLSEGSGNLLAVDEAARSIEAAEDETEEASEAAEAEASTEPDA